MIFNPGIMAAAGGGGGAVVGTYTGDGKTTRTIALGINPSIVFVQRIGEKIYGNTAIILANNNGYGLYLDAGKTSATAAAEISGEALITYDSDPLNLSGATYTYIAFPKA